MKIEELCDRYQAWADDYYRKPSGRPTRAANNVRDALRAMREAKVPWENWLVLIATLEVDRAGPRLIRALQEHMEGSGKVCRSTINDRIAWIRRCFRWAAENELVPADLPGKLDVVRPLKRGRCKAPEGKGVRPVSWDAVTATIAVAPLRLATMIEVHWHTGMRPCEVVIMRKSRIDQSRDVWIYEPHEHKNEHHDQRRIVPLGPLAQNLLGAWWPRAEGEFLWPMKELSYCQAIRRLNRRHDLEHWTPGQIRHSVATRLRKEIGIEAARVVLGHRSASTTEIYAEADAENARRLMRDHG